jgi:hypothetical protein
MLKAVERTTGQAVSIIQALVSVLRILCQCTDKTLLVI